MTGEIITAIIISALIGFVLALGFTQFSAFLTARVFFDNLEFIILLTLAEHENDKLAEIVEKLTGEKVKTVREIRKMRREMMKKEKSEIERK